MQEKIKQPLEFHEKIGIAVEVCYIIAALGGVLTSMSLVSNGYLLWGAPLGIVCGLYLVSRALRLNIEQDEEENTENT